MKRRDLERHLRIHGCRQIDQGGNHARWASPQGDRSVIPRHREIDYGLARKDLPSAPGVAANRRPLTLLNQSAAHCSKPAQACCPKRLEASADGRDAARHDELIAVAA
jgi:mRNA interferase HicA